MPDLPRFFHRNGDGLFHNLLADKEIALLLNHVTSGDAGAPHVVVTLDCCHSGGGTRDNEMLELAAEGIDVRNIDMEDVLDAVQQRNSSNRTDWNARWCPEKKCDR